MWFVGAGPGDPELITMKGNQLLVGADVLVYAGSLVNPALVERSGAKVKLDSWGMSVEQMVPVMVDAAREGKRVVRLKGGDPFVFGRGGEEMEVLLAAGIPVQIVPGITAALGAGAAFGFPLTHRDHAQSCVFVTGHLKDHSVNLDWPALARPGQTLVFYMGIAGLETIAAELQAHGLAGSTPAALVYKATLPEQQRWSCTLATLVDTARQHQVKPPALVIIGSVLELVSG